jgi:hypothetical protein
MIGTKAPWLYIGKGELYHDKIPVGFDGGNEADVGGNVEVGWAYGRNGGGREGRGVDGEADE